MSLLRVNTVRNKEGTGNPDFDRGLLVSSGISTLGAVKIYSGIVTASSGVVTYYGDGSNLMGVNEFTITTQGATSSTVYPTFASNIGVTTIAISQTQIGFIPSSGNLGIGSTLPRTKLDVNGNVTISGVVTATKFVGSGSSLTGIVTSIIAGSNISVSQSEGNVTINASAISGNSPWITNSVGIYTSSSVGIGTTNPQGSLQVGTGVTVYGNTGIVSARQFYGSFKGNADTATSSTSSTRSSTVATSTEIISGTAHNIPYVINSSGFQSINLDGRGNYLQYTPSSGQLSVRNVSVGSSIVCADLRVEGSGVLTDNLSVGISTATGIILTSESGFKYKLYVSDAGVLSTELVP
jgi:hypothetical protein